MNNKQKAVISVLVLIIVFLGLTLWYMATHPARQAAPFTPLPGQSQNIGPQAIVDTGPYHEARMTYPGSTPLAQGNDQAVSVMRAFAEQEVGRMRTMVSQFNAEDIAIQGLDEGRKYSLQGDYTLHQGPHTVTYVYTLVEDTLGAHPNVNYRTFSFDLRTGEHLALEDLFTGTFLSFLSERVRAELPGSIARESDTEADLDYIARGTTPIAENFQNWYIENRNFILIFPPYQVGPYSLGTMTELIPLSELPNLKAQYR